MDGLRTSLSEPVHSVSASCSRFGWFICLTRAFWMAGPRVPAACQPGLERGVRGVSPRLKKGIEEALLPHSKGGPPLPEGRTPLTRKADPPYPKGGPPLPERRAFLTRKAGTPYSRGGCTLYSRAREADTLYSQGGYSLLGRRILLTRELSQAGAIQIFSAANHPGYSLLFGA